MALVRPLVSNGVQKESTCAEQAWARPGPRPSQPAQTQPGPWAGLHRRPQAQAHHQTELPHSRSLASAGRRLLHPRRGGGCEGVGPCEQWEGSGTRAAPLGRSGVRSPRLFGTPALTWDEASCPLPMSGESGRDTQDPDLALPELPGPRKPHRSELPPHRALWGHRDTRTGCRESQGPFQAATAQWPLGAGPAVPARSGVGRGPLTLAGWCWPSRRPCAWQSHRPAPWGPRLRPS